MSHQVCSQHSAVFGFCFLYRELFRQSQAERQARPSSASAIKQNSTAHPQHPHGTKCAPELSMQQPILSTCQPCNNSDKQFRVVYTSDQRCEKPNS